MSQPYKKILNGRELSVFLDEKGEWAYLIRIVSEKPEAEWEHWDVAALDSYEECVEQAEASLMTPE
jgi:hypothetical protein